MPQKGQFDPIQSAINDILSSLGIKSIIDKFSTLVQSPEFQAAMPVMGMALGGGGMGQAPFNFLGPASPWPQTAENAGMTAFPMNMLRSNQPIPGLTLGDIRKMLPPEFPSFGPSDWLDKIPSELIK
jgi:hypothetical protein